MKLTCPYCKDELTGPGECSCGQLEVFKLLDDGRYLGRGDADRGAYKDADTPPSK